MAAHDHHQENGGGAQDQHQGNGGGAHDHRQDNGDGDFNNDNDLEYLRSFPPGYRFAPTDEELIYYYLANKIRNAPLPPNCIVDQNIYRYHPLELLDRYREYGEREWYFFTPRDRKYPNGGRPSRTAGKGFWKATGADKAIIRNNEIIGFRKALVYYKGKVPDGKKTKLIMHEFRVNEDEETKKAKKKNNHKRLDEWVLCRIYEKNEKAVVAAAAASPKAAENIQQGAVIFDNNIAAPSHHNAAEYINQIGVSDNINAEAIYHDHGQPQPQLQPPLMIDYDQYEEVNPLTFGKLGEHMDVLDDNSMYVFHDEDSVMGLDSNRVFDPVVPYSYTSSEMPQQPYMQYMDDQQQQLVDQNYYNNSFDPNPLPLNVLPLPYSYDPLLHLLGHSNSVIDQTNNYSLDDSFQQALLLPSPNYSPGTAEPSNCSLDDISDVMVHLQSAQK